MSNEENHEHNKALVRLVFEEVWSEGNLALIDELFVPNYLFHDPDFPQVRTREECKQWIIENRISFPDIHLTSDKMIALGDQVVVRWRCRATHTADILVLRHIPATGKQVDFTGMAIERFEHGKFVETWHLADLLTLMRQLGLIHATGQAS
jgi:predicted ester cyclase